MRPVLPHLRPQARTPSRRRSSTWPSVGHVDRLVGGATLVLFISLFLPWFGFKFALGTVSWDGLTSHGYLWVTLFISLGIIGLIVAEATGLWQWPASAPIAREQVLLIATVINLVLVLLAFLLKPGGYGFSGIGWSGARLSDWLPPSWRPSRWGGRPFRPGGASNSPLFLPPYCR